MNNIIIEKSEKQGIAIFYLKGALDFLQSVKVRSYLLKEIEDYFIVDFNFSEAHKILNMKQMSDEEDKIFYNGMYICAKNILKDLINKYYPNEKKSKLLEILDKRFPIKYIAAEFSRLRLFIKMSEEEQKRYGEINIV